MAKSVVGYTNDISSDKIVYTGEQVLPSPEDDLLETNTIIDNDPESRTYREVRVYVKKPAASDRQADGNQVDVDKLDFIKNKPFNEVGDGLRVSNKILKVNRDIVEAPARLDDHDALISDVSKDVADISNVVGEHDSDIAKLKEDKQDKLVSGQNIRTINNIPLLGEGNIVIEDLQQDYDRLDNKPIINGVGLNGSMSLADLGINIPTKNSELENDSGYITADYHDELKQDRLESTVNIKTINGNDILGGGNVEIEASNNYNLATNKPLINGVEIKGEKSLIELDIQKRLIPGANILLQDNVISAICNSEIGKSFVTNIAVGYLESGTSIKDTDSIGDILYKMLYREKPKTVDIYYGGSDNTPDSINNLTRLTITKDELLDNFDLLINCGNKQTNKGQYPTLALPDNYILTKGSITEMSSLSIDTLLVHTGGYNIYYIPSKSYDEDLGGIEYRLTIREI